MRGGHAIRERPSEEGSFETFDGTSLSTRSWAALEGDGKRGLLLLHRGHEHTGRLTRLLEELDLPDFWGFAFDLRGHGRSPGRRGHAPDFAHHVRDLDRFARHVSKQHGIALHDLAVVANSVGAVAAGAWVHDYAPPIRAMVLAAPAFRIKLYVPLARPSLRVLARVRPQATISSYVKGRFLTHDPEQAAAYDADPLITPDVSAKVLTDLFDTSDRIVADAGAITVPTLVLSAGSDHVVHVGPQRRFFERLGSPVKEMETYDGFYHGVLYEKDRHRPLARAREFVRRCFAEEPNGVDHLNAHERGYTKDEHDAIMRPGPMARTAHAAQRAGLRTVGRLSQGIGIGLRHGFDSGVELDHVYANEARGITPLGRMIDRWYLDQIGWRGIRQRKVHLEEALSEEVRARAARGDAVRIMDIAGGPGRYLVDTLQRHRGVSLEVVVRDNREENLDQGRRLAKERGVEGIRYERADAFDPRSYEKLAFAPDILVISGLYELFPDNDLVLRSLKAATGAIAEGGCLIYTGQPWHPQLAQIAHTLTNREGKPWIMRRRTQGEMDALVRHVGFEKKETRIDPWGIFTVSTAERRR